MPALTGKTPSRIKSVKDRVVEDTLFETPALGVFITRTGAIRRGALAHETVRPLELLAADLKRATSPKHELKVFDTPIHTLANTGDPDLAATLGFTK